MHLQAVCVGVESEPGFSGDLINNRYYNCVVMMMVTWQSSREVSLSLASAITQWVGTPHQDSANQVRGL